MIYLELLWSFFQIGLFSIGGGYASMPLIQHQAVELRHWLTMGQFADIIAIAEMTPGPISINSATFVGMQTAGVPGAMVATIGCVSPSCVIVMTLAYLYYRFRRLTAAEGILAGLRPAVIAMIASACISLITLSLYGQQTPPDGFRNINYRSLVIFGAGVAVLRKWRVNPIFVIAGAGGAGIVLALK